MGFLERMIGDVVGKNTPLSNRMARKLVRKIGVGNLAMAGGAVLLGTMAAGKAGLGRGGSVPGTGGFAGQGHTAPSGTTMPPTQGGGGARPAAPPLPPTPTASSPAAPQASAPPPPLPPLPGAPGAGQAAPPAFTPLVDDDSDELPPAVLFPLIRTMVAAALADGSLEDAERQMIVGRLDEARLTEEQQAQVRQDLVLPLSPPDLAGLAETPEAREVLFRTAALVVLADGVASDLERSWLRRLGNAFDFDDARRQALEEEMFGAAAGDEGGDEGGGAGGVETAGTGAAGDGGSGGPPPPPNA